MVYFTGQESNLLQEVRGTKEDLEDLTKKKGDVSGGQERRGITAQIIPTLMHNPLALIASNGHPVEPFD